MPFLQNQDTLLEQIRDASGGFVAAAQQGRAFAFDTTLRQLSDPLNIVLINQSTDHLFQIVRVSSYATQTSEVPLYFNPSSGVPADSSSGSELSLRDGVAAPSDVVDFRVGEPGTALGDDDVANDPDLTESERPELLTVADTHRIMDYPYTLKPGESIGVSGEAFTIIDNPDVKFGVFGYEDPID